MSGSLDSQTSGSVSSLPSPTLSTAPSSLLANNDKALHLNKNDHPLFNNEYHQFPSPGSFLSTSAIPFSNSHTGLFGLSKASRSSIPKLRPSPSLSILQNKIEDSKPSDVTTFPSHTRRRSNSLSTADFDKSNLKDAPLVLRRQSQTFRYLGTDDFKSAFAINLLKLKEREKVEGDSLAHLSESAFKATEIGGGLMHHTHSQLNVFPDGTHGLKTCPVDSETSSVVLSSTAQGGSRYNVLSNPYSKSSTATELKKFSPGKVSPEAHKTRLQVNRMEEELEARNEVISILAQQFSNQLETNDRLTHELAALRAAYASLQSSCSDYVDQVELLKTQSRREEPDEEIERIRKEAEAKVRDLRQLLDESKRAISRLQVEIRHQGHRRSLQNYHLGTSYNLASIEKFNELGSTPAKRSTILVLHRPETSEGPNTQPSEPSLLEKLALHFGPENANARRDSLSQKLLSLASLQKNDISKPERPPKNIARSMPSSPARLKNAKGNSLKSPSVSNQKDCAIQTCAYSEVQEIKMLRGKCARLELDLKESEDSRIASQAALDGLRAFISSQPADELCSMKLPPLPTDAESSALFGNNDEDMRGRWKISQLLSRSNPLKSGASVPPSPHLKSPALHRSPALGNAFSSFNLWTRSPVL